MEPEQPDQPQIAIEPAQMAGVYSNWAQVTHSPYEFTLDFVRLDSTSAVPRGIVVSRVSLSPLMVSQLIEALTDNWAKYAEKALPIEWRQGGAGNPDDDGGDHRTPGDAS